MNKNNKTIIIAVFLVAWLLSTVAFIVLKCFGVLSWSWWWLLVPVLGTPGSRHCGLLHNLHHTHIKSK